MPKKHTGRIGGFAGQNSGQIDNCFSIVKIKKSRDIAGGFAGENMGNISHSFYSNTIKKLLGGVSGGGVGKEKESYFFHNEDKDSKRLKRLRDHPAGVRIDDVSKAEDSKQFLTALGFNTEEIWEQTGNSQILRFIPEKWLFDATQTTTFASYAMDVPAEENPYGGGLSVLERVALGVETEEDVLVTKIKTANELFEFARKINEGDRALAAAYIRLEKDLDLGGKEWEPIGSELAKGFTGLFDGCGHTIKNFKIKSKSTKAKGFFGYLKGEVYNLTVDCVIKGTGTAGGIAAYCEEGTIAYCASIIDIKCKSGVCGGLVGANTGRIFNSYAAGKIAPILVLRFLPLLLLPLLSLSLLPPLLLLTDNPFSLSVFAPVPYDRDAIPINDGLTPNTDGNFVSFQFEQYIDISLSTGLCEFGFINPGNSNHDIVVQLHFTDGQATRIMGSTGRSAEEQQRLESAPNYDPEVHRTVIAESGAIPPGYGLNDLRLTPHENGATIPPGDYNAMVYLIFYDIGTHNRAMLESQLPVVISVHH